ncbi:TIR domain-containing protein [Bradyrhizobium sp. USDA 4451]
MKIFISHKMPADTPAVKEFGDRLALYAGSAIEISHAGKFDKGADFRNLIEQEILSSDIFILYYTSDSYDWSFCIFEAGLFKAHMVENPDRKLVVLRGHESKIPESLADLISVTATTSDLISLRL